MIGLYCAQAWAAVRTSFADRANFALQLGGMVLNDIFFLALWVMFFAGFRSVGGWTLADTALLIGMMMFVFGFAGVFLGGYRDLAAALLRDDLDGLLTQPKPLLPQLLARESSAAGWGDVIAGAVVLSFAGLSWAELPLLATGMAAGLIVYVSAAISFACMAFWFAGARTLARDLTDFTVLFSSNPAALISDLTKVLAFTVLPAGFVVAMPVRFIREPSPAALAIVLAAALGYAAVAAGLFALGLRRYRRGAVPSLGGV